MSISRQIATGDISALLGGVGPVSIAPTASSLLSSLTSQQSVHGTVGVSDTGYPNYWANFLNISSDDANVGANFGSGLTLFHNYGGSNMFGGRNTLSVYSIKTANTNAANTNRNYVAALFDMHAKASDGGTDPLTDPKGAAFAINPQVILESGATSYLEATGAEFNVAVQTGASVYNKSLCSFVWLSSDAVQGSAYDNMLALSALVGAVGSRFGIFFGDMNGQFPIAASGSLMGGSHGSIANGIDLSNLTFSGSAFKSNGFSVSGTGTMLVSGQYQLSGGGIFNFVTRSLMKSPADGVIEFSNNAGASFTRIDLGGTTSAFPAIASFGAVAGFRQADGTIATFSALPAASTCEGAMAPISDSTTATWGATITGSGSNHVLAYSDGTNWTVAAK